MAGAPGGASGGTAHHEYVALGKKTSAFCEKLCYYLSNHVKNNKIMPRRVCGHFLSARGASGVQWVTNS